MASQTTFVKTIEQLGPYTKPDNLANFYKDQYKTIGDENQLLQDFKTWSQEKVFILFHDTYTGRHFAVPVARRGNQRYRWRILNKWHKLKDDVRMLQRKCGRNKTHVLFITLTYDPKNYNGQDDLWQRVSKDYNNYMSRLRRQFGKISAIRAFQAHKSGNPHIHAILVFHDRAFTIKKHSKRYRLSQYPSDFKKHWIHGFSDFSGVQKIERVMRYVMGYLAKGLQMTRENILGMAKMWVYNIRAFSISTDLLRLDISSTNKNEKDRFEYLGIITADCNLNIREIKHLQWLFADSTMCYMVYIHAETITT